MHRTSAQVTRCSAESLVTRPAKADEGFTRVGLAARGVAQLGSALALGARGRRFKSCHPDMTQSTDRRSEDQPLKDILAATHLGVLATLKRDGRPQLSDVSHLYDPEAATIRVSITEGRAKTANLRRDPRASVHVRPARGGGYAVAEGTAQLSQTAGDLQDVTVEALVDLYRTINGEHPDWDEYREAMVKDRRIVLTILVDNVYGWAP